VVHTPLPITLSPPQQYLLLLETEAAAAVATASLPPRSSAEDLVQTSVELSTELETQVQIRFECTNPSPPDLEETAAEHDVILEEETRQERQREGGEAISLSLSLSLSLPRPTTKFSNWETHLLDAASAAEGKQASLSTNHSTPFPSSTNQNTPLRSRVTVSIQSCSIRNPLAFSPDACPPGDPAGPELSRKDFFFPYWFSPSAKFILINW
jgi:hypothetical protein